MGRQSLRLYGSFNECVFHCLNPSSSPLSHVRQTHAHILKSGLSHDAYLSTKLLSLYANHLSFTDADLLLDSLPNPDLASFSSLIYAFSKHSLFNQALRVFSRMLSRGYLPDSYVLPSVIKASGSLSAFGVGKQVHGVAFVCGFESDSFVQSSLLHMYVKCDQMKDAHKVFDRLPQPDVVAWSALIAGYARKGCASEAMELFSEMECSGVEPNLVSWNGMIAGFNHSGVYSEAIHIFEKMQRKGFQPDGTSISSVLPAAGDLKDLNAGVQIHDCVIKQGFGSDKCVASALIDMYGKCGCALEMSRVFDEMEQVDIGTCNALVTGLSRNGLVDDALEAFMQFKDQGMQLNVVSWTSMIASCSQNSKDNQALKLFREMQMAGVRPNSITIPCILPVCGNTAALLHGKAAHCYSLRRGFSNDVYVGSALIDMYAKCGKIHAAWICFDKMNRKNLVCWNAIMAGYAMHGKPKEAIDIFQSMLRSGEKPDSVSFTCILSACSQSGFTDEGWLYFNSMSRDHGIEARMEHYACMVTLLGRAGRLQEAFSLIEQMPFKPDACVWGALLSSCRVHNNVGLAEIAAKSLFELEPENPGNYILLSNIYANKGLWDKVNLVRDRMRGVGLRKNPGCSWIEVKNKIHMILAGDKSLPQMAQVIEKLNKLSMEMKKLGYYPDTDSVLQDVDDQDKEQILCEHSEKLAVAFGLLNTKPKSPLLVIKNLRICGDCHTVIKFISAFEGREILVRDPNRFHHFIDGTCSCGDFW